MSAGNPFPPVPTQTPLEDKNAASGISWPWLQWFLQLNNFFSQIARAVVTSFAGRVGAIQPQLGDYPPTLGGTGQSDWHTGDLLVGAGVADTALLPVGAPTSVLTADPGSPDGVKWSLPATAAVSSVFGRTGEVAAVAGDYGPTNGGTGQTAWTKGNLLVGQAVNVTALLVAGADTSFLVADSTAINGVRWGTFADAETPAGTVDGINKIFTLAVAPNPALSLQLFLNAGGAANYILQNGLYVLAGNTVTYTTAPIIGSTHLAWYRA